MVGGRTNQEWLEYMSQAIPNWEFHAPETPGAPWTATDPDGNALAEWSAEELLTEARYAEIRRIRGRSFT